MRAYGSRGCEASHSRARRWLLEGFSQRNAKGRTHSNTDGDANCDVVEGNAKSHTDSSADGNAHAGGRLTFLAIGQVGPPMQSSTTTTLRM